MDSQQYIRLIREVGSDGKTNIWCVAVVAPRVSEVSRGSQDLQAFQDSLDLKVRVDPEERR